MKFLKALFLFPLGVLYGSIISIRNVLYKSNFIGSASFEIPVIAVGNLSVGGTGKTPFVEYLIELLHNKYSIAVLSRGYKRKTTGYIEVQPFHTVIAVGDEPLMLKLKYPSTIVTVGEQRIVAIPKLLHQHPSTQVIVLDDAFQHQSVRPAINILLTTYDNPFWDDSILPIGTLRESITGKERANIIVVTKCPSTLNKETIEMIRHKIQLQKNQQLFFSTIEYGLPYNILNPEDKLLLQNKNSLVLLTGIANSNSLIDYLNEFVEDITHYAFNDHHFFEQREINAIYNNHPFEKNWLTTEKDAVRLAAYKNWFMERNINIYCLPIKSKMIGDNKQDFDKMIIEYLNFFYKSDLDTNITTN